MRAEQDQGALDDFSVAIDLKEDFAQAYHERAGIRKRRGDLQGAHFDYQTAIAYQPLFPLAGTSASTRICTRAESCR